MLKRLILTVTLSIFICVSFTLMLYSKVLSENDILDVLDNIDYYDYAYKDIMKKLEVELPNSDLTYVYDKYITKDKIKKDIKNILDNYYIKENNNIKKEFYEVVFKNFGSKDDENIKSLVNNLSDIYYNNLFRIDKLDGYIKKLPLKESSRGWAFVTLAITIFLIISFRKEIIIYNAFIADGLIFLLPKIFIIFKDVLKNFYYYNNNMSYFIKMYGYNIINIYFKYGLVLLVIGIIGFTLKSIKERQLTKGVK